MTVRGGCLHFMVQRCSTQCFPCFVAPNSMRLSSKTNTLIGFFVHTS